PAGARRRGAGAPLVFAICAIAYAPALWLAMHQPAAATAWIGRFPGWPDALFVRPPIALVIIAAIVAIIALIRWNRFATMAAIPIALALLFALFGRQVYFPMRFESVLAPPLMLALATAIESRQGKMRELLATPLLAIGALISIIGIIDHRNRPMNEYRAAAWWAGAHISVKLPLVASGYLYLETVVNARDNVIAFPAEQAEHPGWRALPDAGSVPPRGWFYWIGE